MSGTDPNPRNPENTALPREGPRTTLSPRETVVLFPTYGHFSDGDGTWRIPVSGAVFEPGVVTVRRRILLRLLRRVMNVPPEALESSIFRERIGAFIAAAERGRSIALQSGSIAFPLRRKTRRDGRFSGVLRLAAGDLDRLVRHGQIADGWLNFDVALPDGDQRAFGGRAALLPARGASVISDIDDTIKHSAVWSRRALLANTFLREFEYVAGMAERYQVWAAGGAAFHYVSSSPWQLYGPLADLQRCAGFPEGSFHLRAFRLRDQMLRGVPLLRRHGKLAAIRRVLRAFPERRFVLIGDSGERDPELYGAVARRYPRQVASIHIRLVHGRPWSDERGARAFRRIDRDRWSVFEDAAELPDRLTAAGGSPLA